MLTNTTPYEGQSEGQVILAIMEGKLPQLPETVTFNDAAVKDLLWEICQACWKLDPKERIEMKDVLTKLQVFRTGGRGKPI